MNFLFNCYPSGAHVWTVERELIGHWMIIDCVPRGKPEEMKKIEGTRFELNDSGQVVWELSENSAPLPLAVCDTYEVIMRESKGDCLKNIHLRFGTYRSHVLDFIVNFIGQELVLKNRSGVLWCQRVTKPNFTEHATAPYSFASALDDGFFSDLEILADNDKSFKVHSTILKLSAPNMNWEAKPPPLSGLPQNVLGATLHFLYAQSLPTGMSDVTCNLLRQHFANTPQLEGLTALCNAFSCHSALQAHVIELITEVVKFSKYLSNAFTESSGGRGSIVFEPPRFCAFIKRTAQCSMIYIAKFLLIVQYYNQNKPNISTEAIQHVLLFVQSQWHFIWGNLRKFLCNMMDFISHQGASSRLDLAFSLVPEIEMFFAEATVLVELTKKVIEAILKSMKEEKCPKNVTQFEEKFNHALIKKEFVRFENLLAKIMLLQDEMNRKKHMFESLNSVHKVRNVNANLEHLFGEYHLILWRLEQSAGKLNCRIWNHSKFCFQVASAKVCDFLSRFRNEKPVTRELMISLCQFVGRKKFSKLMVEMDLLDIADIPEAEMLDSNTPNEPNAQKPLNYELNLTDILCASPDSSMNTLSEASELILASKEKTDMIFEVIEPDTVVRFPAHRVIVAARCVWFRRALTSGMQEDIQRRIEVHNCSVQLFEIFLRFLYSGRLPAGSLACQQFIELLVLADCYEFDSLKTVCERNLKRFLTSETVFEFLDWAEQLNAPNLKMDCISFIADHTSLMQNEAYKELSDTLKNDVDEAIHARHWLHESKTRETLHFDSTLRGIDSLHINQ